MPTSWRCGAMNLHTKDASLADHAITNESRPLDVALVSMPFAQLPMPSIALGILKSTLASRGLHARVTHFTLDFAERIGVQLYSMIAVGFPGNQALAADWVFSHLLPGDFADNPEEYLRQIIDNEDPDSLIGPVDPVSSSRVSAKASPSPVPTRTRSCSSARKSWWQAVPRSWGSRPRSSRTRPRSRLPRRSSDWLRIP